MRPPCFECGAVSENDHHVVPQSRGGTATVPLCVRCHGLAHGVSMAAPRLTKEALAAKKARGERTGGVPFGMQLDPDGVHLSPHPEEQAVINGMCKLRAAGFSIRRIADELNAMGSEARGVRWHATTVARLLRARASTPPAEPKAPQTPTR